MPLRKKAEPSRYTDHIKHPNLNNYSFPPKASTFPPDFPQPSREAYIGSTPRPGEQARNFSSVQADEENEEFELSPAFHASFGNGPRPDHHHLCTSPQTASGPAHGTKTQMLLHHSSQNSLEFHESYEETNAQQNSFSDYNQNRGTIHQSYEDLASKTPGAIYNVTQPSNRPACASYGRTQGHWYQKLNMSAPDLAPSIPRQSHKSTAKHGRQGTRNAHEEDSKHKESRAAHPVTKNLIGQAAPDDKPYQPYYTTNGGKGYAQGFAHMPCEAPPYFGNQTSAANAKDWEKVSKSPNSVPERYHQHNGVHQQERNEREDKLTGLRQHNKSFSNRTVGKPASMNRSSDDQADLRTFPRHDSGFAGNKYGGLVGMSKPTSYVCMELQHPNSSFRSNDSYRALSGPRNHRQHSGRSQDQQPSKHAKDNSGALKLEGKQEERHSFRDDYQQSRTPPSQGADSTGSSEGTKMTTAEFCQLMKKTPPMLTKASPVLGYLAGIMEQGEELEGLITKMVKQTSSDKVREAITPKPKSTKQEVLQAAKVFHGRIVQANQAIIDAVNANKKLNCENPSPFQDLDLERVRKCYACVSSYYKINEGRLLMDPKLLQRLLSSGQAICKLTWQKQISSKVKKMKEEMTAILEAIARDNKVTPPLSNPMIHLLIVPDSGRWS